MNLYQPLLYSSVDKINPDPLNQGERNMLAEVENIMTKLPTKVFNLHSPDYFKSAMCDSCLHQQIECHLRQWYGKIGAVVLVNRLSFTWEFRTIKHTKTKSINYYYYNNYHKKNNTQGVCVCVCMYVYLTDVSPLGLFRASETNSTS